MEILLLVYPLAIGAIAALILGSIPKLKIKLPGGIITMIIVGGFGAFFSLNAFVARLFNICPVFKDPKTIHLRMLLGAIVTILLAKCCLSFLVFLSGSKSNNKFR